MAADLSRYDDWLAFLTALPRRVPTLQVVVVNGSAVTGGWDEHSDLDVEAWCSGDAATTYDAVLELVQQDFDVDHVWHLPEATWPTGRQCFVHLQPDAGDLSRLTPAGRPGRPDHPPSRSPWTPGARPRPGWHDFGLRYLRTDLPAGMAERVEALLPGPDLAVRSRAAFAWQDEVLPDLS